MIKISKRNAQEDDVYNYMLENGIITQAAAYEELGCSRLAARIYRMKKWGIQIGTRIIYYTKKNGRPGKYAEYWLEDEYDPSGN